MLDYTIPPSWENIKKDLLWVEFKAYKIQKMKGFVPNTKNPDDTCIGSIIGKWKFLAPMEIMEDVTHSWEEIETIHSRVASKAVSWKKTYNELGQIGKSVVSDLDNWKAQPSDSISTGTSLSQLALNATKIGIEPYKMDLPITYMNSNRLTYSMTFSLALLPDKTSAGKALSELTKKGIFEPVRELEKLSCAIMESEFVKISFPAVFSIKTVGSDLINIPRAAITSVQPTWKGPFVGGYPMSCELQVTFINMLPLYSNNFEGNFVTTNNPHESQGYQISNIESSTY